MLHFWLALVLKVICFGKKYWDLPTWPEPLISLYRPSFPLRMAKILIGGGTNLYGSTATDEYGAWIAKIKDAGEVMGFLNTSPGKFSIINTMGSRPNTLSDKILNEAQITVKDIIVPISLTDYQNAPACLATGASFPSPTSPAVHHAIHDTNPKFYPRFVLNLPGKHAG